MFNQLQTKKLAHKIIDFDKGQKSQVIIRELNI